ncbi:MAG: glycosyltransferase family 2 protein, partial [Terriglobales bacterium]
MRNNRDDNARELEGLVSVIITTFNRSQYIGQAIDSVRSQTWPNIEIIVVDDGST